MALLMARSRLWLPIRPVLLSCQGCSVKCPISMIVLLTAVLSRAKKFVDDPHKLVGLLDLGMMPALVQHHQPGAGDGGMIRLRRAQGHNGVLPSPDNQRRQ